MMRDFTRALHALRPHRLRTLWSFFKPHLWPHRRRMAGAFALTVLATGFLLLQPWPIKILFDHVLIKDETYRDLLPLSGVLPSNPWHLVWLISGVIILVAVGRGFTEYHRTVLTKYIGQKVVVTMRMRLFEHVQRLSLAFHTRSQSGDILMRLTGDINNLRDLFVEILITTASSVLVITTIVGLMLWIDWHMTLMVLCVFPFILLVSAVTGVRIREAAHHQRKKESKVSVAAHEALLGMPIIQAFSREDSAQEIFDRQTRGSFKEGMRVARLEALAAQWTEVILALGVVIVVALGVAGVLADPPVRTPGDLLLFYFYLRILNRPVRGMARLVSRAAKAAASAERVMEILEVNPDIVDSPDAIKAPTLTGLIEFRGVHFAHEKSPVLQGVDLRIEPGQRVAIMGMSGTGKTTLCSLLTRAHDPDQGQVLLDGHDIRDMRVRSIREQIGIMLQDPMLFGTTVFENIAFGKPDATMDQVQKAARRARAHNFIEQMPEGYESMIAERGTSLSEGQKQRIALARSFLRRAPILILDEPTSNVDAVSERLIIKAIRKMTRHTTCLLVTHNTRIIDFVDRVVVLDRGVIAEDGPPSDLLRGDGLLARLRREQESSES